MKRFLCILMSALLLISALAYAETVQPAAKTTEQKLEQMLPVLDSLARAMGIEGEIAYSAEDAEFVWAQLYLMGANWSADNEQVRVDGDRIVVPAALMQEYAAASFFGMQTLPELPAIGEVSFTSVLYDEATDSYTLPASDASQTYIVIERYAVDPANSLDNLSVGVGLYNAETGARLGGLYVALVARLTLDSATMEPVFPYSVTEARVESDGDFDSMQPTSCAIRYVAPGYAQLSSGDRGDAVKALQKRLNQLGYNCGAEDGVFGSRTRTAVRYFQDALGVSQNGVATDALQQRLFASNAPAFQAYVTLSSGATGVRVEKLQSRLRELGYLAEPVDGDFGARTKEAVKRFQAKAGLKQDGIAGAKTLQALDKKNAPKCGEYISLQKGDTGIRVTEMQDQLRKLGFLGEKKSSGTYDSKTVAAVKSFAQAVGVSTDGKKADAALIGKMFSYVAPTPTPTAAPTAEPTSEPTATPTAEPTAEPTATPTAEPTSEPTATPTAEPTSEPTATPTAEPTSEPTATPTAEPTSEPTATPTAEPTSEPTATPTAEPTPEQAITDAQLKAFVDLLNQTLKPETDYTSRTAVQWLQGKLSATVSGVYDEATVKAVSDYQTAHGLTASGLADQETLNHMMAVE